MTLFDALRILELEAPITRDGVDRAGHAIMQRLEDLVRGSPADADLNARAQAYAGEVRAAHALLRERPEHLYPYRMVAPPPELQVPPAPEANTLHMAGQAPAPVPVAFPPEVAQAGGLPLPHPAPVALPAWEIASQDRSTPPPLPAPRATVPVVRCPVAPPQSLPGWARILVWPVVIIACGVGIWYGVQHFHPSGNPAPRPKGTLSSKPPEPAVQPVGPSDAIGLRGISPSDDPSGTGSDGGTPRRLVVETAPDGSIVAHMPDGATIRQTPGGNQHLTFGPKGCPPVFPIEGLPPSGADAQFLREHAPGAGTDPAARARLKRFADMGYAQAQYLLAEILLSPPSPPSDVPEGLRLLEKAAAQKHRVARYMLACTYLDGIGRPADPKKGVSMLKSLTDGRTDGRSFPEADLRLADCHRDGIGVPCDYEYALSIYDDWQSEAAAQYRISLMYQHGCGLPKDDAEALKWLHIAVVDSHPPALYQMGLRYAKGEGVPKDEIKAAEAYEQAAKLGYAPAQAALGRCYQNARGVPFTSGLAIHYFQQAAVQGFPHAQDYLGTAYARGDCIWKDPKQAAGWYAKAAAQGHGPAQMHLGKFLLEDHPGLPADPVRALAWFIRAESQDEEGAAEMVRQTREELSPYEIAEAERAESQLPRTTPWNQWQPVSR
ncbi:hypothetical protein [Prosthecobacter sp.]|uniref:hypothetical protein n=1 Tax=Prosthecobacter sp. TaxID=1965333 RepID=UPI003783DF46